MNKLYGRTILIIACLVGASSTSFAAWNWDKNVTRCWGNQCRHVVVDKHCNNYGQCSTYRHYNNWYR